MRILAALDLTPIDKQITSFLSKNLEVLGDVEKIYFLYVEKNLELPQAVKELMNTVPNDERIENIMQKEVSDRCSNEFLEKCDFLTVEGHVLDQLVHWSNVKMADLVVLGQKSKKDGSGLVAHDFARKSKGNILFLPNREVVLKKFLVPVDFSRHSKAAMQMALDYAKNMAGSSIHCLHVYSVPIGYTKVGKTYEEMAEIMRGHSEADMKRFIGEFDLGDIPVTTDSLLEDNHGFGEIINRESMHLGADMVVMGSKGQTFMSHVLLGSVAEKMIFLSEKIPLMIVKLQDENFNFWQAIKQI